MSESVLSLTIKLSEQKRRLRYGSNRFYSSYRTGFDSHHRNCRQKNADGSIQILAYANTPSSDCIKKGAIFNLDKTTQVLVSVIQKLEEDLQASIKKVYVGIGGQSIRSTRNNVTKQLGEDTKISQALIESLMESNREISLIDQEILDVEPQEYKVGNNLLTEPVGISADRIEGRYLNIIAHHTLKDRITKCFNQTKYEIADYFLSPVVTASVVLTDSENAPAVHLWI